MSFFIYLNILSKRMPFNRNINYYLTTSGTNVLNTKKKHEFSLLFIAIFNMRSFSIEHNSISKKKNKYNE